MTLSHFLDECFRREIAIFLSGEQLHYHDPRRMITPELKAKFDQYETKLIAYLRRSDGNSRPFAPLSAAQKTLWFLAQVDPDNAAHKIRFEARILSKVDIPALRQALQALVDRHPSLRTTFAAIDGEPIQHIQEAQEVFFEAHDSVGWERERLTAYLQQITETPFDLRSGPLFRTYLMTLPRGKHLFWLLLHPIIADFWSLELLIEEFGILYSAYSQTCMGLDHPGSPHMTDSPPGRGRGGLLGKRQTFSVQNPPLPLPGGESGGFAAKNPYLSGGQGWVPESDFLSAIVTHPQPLPGDVLSLSKGGEFTASPPLPLLEGQYTDYIRWKLNMLASPEGEAHRAYLQHLLRGELPVLHLPTDRPRPPALSYRTAAYFSTLGSELTRQIKAIAREERLSLYTLLVSAYFVLLHRYTGQDDILIGAPRSEQGHRKFKGIVGQFDNPVPLRADLSGNLSFRALLRQMHQQLWEAFDHEDYPSHLLPQQLHLHRDPSRPSLFQTLFLLQEQHQRRDISPFVLGQGGERLEINGLLLQSVGLHEQMPIFVELQLTLFEEHGALTALWQYHADLFDEATIARLAERFQILLTGIVAQPERRIAELPIMSAAERHEMLVAWNNTAADYPKDKCIHEVFEAQVERTPDAIAVVWGTHQLTYRDLNQRANQVARYLSTLGVGPDVLVGICVERSLEMIVGILGILKAGGAYVPFDPEHPRERLAYMLSDSQIPVLLTQESLTSQFSAPTPQLLCLDRDWHIFSAERADNLPCNVTIGNRVYLIYTSGSTGQPKGVLITHQNLLNLVYWHQRAFEVTAADRATQLAGLAFDAAVWEIWPYLTAGSALYLIPSELLASPPPLRDYLLAHQITLTFAPTPLAEQLLAIAWPTDAPLRMMLTGGDQLHQSPSRAIPFKLINNYGPTESTVVATSVEIPPQTHDRGSPPIGRPIANTQIYILDRDLQPVPPGISGELYLGGAGLAQGYLNRPELTQEQFIPNLFDARPGVRLYKTGDVARYLPDGKIEFLGRRDFQVKIRGFRIELGEIETLLTQHPAVKETVVMAREDAAGEKKLVAYVVPNKAAPEAHDEERGKGLPHGHVAQWQQLYEQTYAQSTSPQDPTFQTVGWNSSYTGQPLPEIDMREWVERTVERIRALRPERVLEIGCGTGLLLFRLAPQCTQYWGVDFSAAALDFIRRQLAQSGQALPQVRLCQQTADDLTGIPAETFDLVLLNSVTQHFPNSAYFLQVLEGMIRAVAPSGTIFIGDVRSLPLLEMFHTSVQLAQAPLALSVKRLRQRIQRQIANENELVIAPEFFHALQRHFPEIGSVRVQPKRGRARNELTKFRYDVLLTKAAQAERISDRPRPEIPWLDWRKGQVTLATLRQQFQEERPARLGLTHIPNARLALDQQAAALLRQRDHLSTVGDVQAAVRQYAPAEAIDPEELWTLGADNAYQVELSWARSDPEGGYDALFVRRDIVDRAFPVEFLRHATPSQDALSNYANNPLQREHARKLIPSLRKYLQEKLPEYMLPATFVLLEQLPLTPNGKVDRRALPAPERTRPDLETSYTAPRSDVEQLLAEGWAGLLDLEPVGIHDDFFELGGDSLTATQILAHIRTTFQIELPVPEFFEAPTIAQLAVLIERKLFAELEAMSDADAQRLLASEP